MNYTNENEIDEFYVLCAKLSMEKDSLAEIEKQMEKLALNGNLKALSKYFEIVQPDKRNTELVKVAEKLENSDDSSAEKWEIVASFHKYDKVCISTRSDIKTAYDLLVSVKKNEKYFNIVLDEFHHKRKLFKDVETSSMKFKWLYENFMDTVYCHALKRAQENYYIRFVREKDIKDANSYTNLAFGKNSLSLGDTTKMKIINNHKLLGRDWFLRFAKNHLKKVHKNGKYSSADYSACNMVINLTDSNKEDFLVLSGLSYKKSKEILNEISDKECNISDVKLERTKNCAEKTK